MINNLRQRHIVRVAAPSLQRRSATLCTPPFLVAHHFNTRAPKSSFESHLSTKTPDLTEISFSTFINAKYSFLSFNIDLNIIGSFVLSIKHEEAEVQILLCSPSVNKNEFYF